MGRAILAIALTALFGGSAAAQSSASGDLRDAIVSAAGAGWKVEAHLADSTFHRGKITSVMDSSFVIGRLAPIDNDSVIALYRVDRDNTGMLIVGGLGAAVGLFIMGLSSQDAPCASCGMGLYALAGLGAVLGAFISGDNMEVLWRK